MVPIKCARINRYRGDKFTHIGSSCHSILPVSCSMRKSLYRIAEDRKGSPVMYELIEVPLLVLSLHVLFLAF